MEITEKQYLEAVDLVKKYRQQLENKINECNTILDEDVLIVNTELSSRTINGLIDYFYGYGYTSTITGRKKLKVSKLNGMSIKDFSKTRNVGRFCVEELINYCQKHQIKLYK